MKLEKTKFVYIDWQNDYEKYVLSKLEKKNENVFMNTSPDRRKRGMLWFLYKMHMTPKINNIISLPFKTVWNRGVLQKSIKKSLRKQDRIVFIFSGMAYRYSRIKLVEYLRKKFPGCRCIYVFSDKVALYKKIDPHFSMEKLESYFDSVLSYNEEDVEKYSLIKEPCKPYDFSDVEVDVAIPESDIFFVGKEKGRYDDIIKIFEKAKSAGLKCDFTILEVSPEKRLYKDEIEYERRIPYLEMLKRERRSKSILNIMQDGTNGITLRDYEAFGMNKILITNSDAIKFLPNYSEDKVIKLDEFEDKIAMISSFNSSLSWKRTFAISADEYYNKLEKITFNC